MVLSRLQFDRRWKFHAITPSLDIGGFVKRYFDSPKSAPSGSQDIYCRQYPEYAPFAVRGCFSGDGAETGRLPRGVFCAPWYKGHY